MIDPVLLRALNAVAPDLRPDAGALELLLPDGTGFADDEWELGSWHGTVARPRKETLSFGKIAHPEMRDAAKVIILERRRKRGIGPVSARHYLAAARALGDVLGARPLSGLTSGDVHRAEAKLLVKSDKYLSALATMAGELRRLYGIAVDYKAPKTAAVRHGTRGTDEGRSAKLIPDAVLMDLLALLPREDIPDDDRLLLSAIALNLGCGWRVSELATLPADCLFRDEGQLYVRGYPGKGGKIAPKLVAPALAPMVEEAVATILRLTGPGRAIAKAWPLAADPDWRTVLRDDTAILYFARKLLHRWGSDPDNRLINPDAAWSRNHGWVDVLGALESYPNVNRAAAASGLNWETFDALRKQQLASREGRIWTPRPKSVKGWMLDARVCDRHNLFRMMGFHSGYRHHSPAIRSLVAEALEFQLSGEVIPPPPFDAEIEARHAREKPVLLSDRTGTPLLYVEDALFVMPRFLIGAHATKTDDWQRLTPEHIMQWLGGTTGRASVFERYGIIDPRSGKIATFTSHQIRHWLETNLHKGGLTDAQIAALMNRRSTAGNSVYNQMTNAERREKVREGIHEGVIGGLVAGVVTRADVTREEAEDILDSRLRQVNVMPHGFCLKDLATEPCPHHMSCFSTAAGTAGGGTAACSHLLVDRTDPDQIAALRRENANARAMVEMFEDDPELGDSPQVAHFRTIADTTASFLPEADP
ncbi:hypothetical protein [Mangrovicoccus sp. HB161399]|uniref:hypothetical protein n=1 Tax=Mangrovicoccus sp. HB161399 TaxID=2720392 RepID=UPI001551CDAE|nr:hypothetical protein [Mangrovicoccus sp. HB161399]